MAFQLSDEKKKELLNALSESYGTRTNEIPKPLLDWLENLLEAQYWSGFNHLRG